jgi:hypothetical protein
MGKGKFVAYYADDDKIKVEKEDLDTSNNLAYYRTILTKALDDNFTRAPITSTDESFIGTITKGVNLDVKKALELMANEEGKYLYKWEEQGEGQASSPVKNGEDVVVLKEFARVDARNYSTSLSDITVLAQIKEQITTIKSEIESKPGLLKPPLSFKEMDGDRTKLKVTLNTEALVLYLDRDIDTLAYKYAKEGNVYEPAYTWIPKTWDATVEINMTNNNLEHYKDGKTDEISNFRYLYYLYLEYHELRQEENKELRIENTRLKNLKQDEKAVPRLSHIGTIFKKPPASVKAELSTLLEDFPEKKRNEAVEAAKRAAKVIPGNYRCFYYEKNEAIDGFLTDVSISAEGDGSGSYAGRADRAIEVDYRWRIVPKPETDTYQLAELLSIVIGLSKEKLIPNGDPDPPGFHETNCPDGMFKYYKKFLVDQKRRNKPPISVDANGVVVSPGKPRTGLKRVKTEDLALYRETYPQERRKMKKGPSLTGEALGIGDKYTRVDAGSVMAESLKRYVFYRQAKSEDTKRITTNKLPATAFAHYVVKHDAQAKKQWRNDNANQPLEVSTDQEWCHLYGHGDGGNETLDNFISGSKHCNTEQLAIEKGQRRVSQRDVIPKIAKERLKWRITADLIPNRGTRATEIWNTKAKAIQPDKLNAAFDKIKEALKKDAKDLYETLNAVFKGGLSRKVAPTSDLSEEDKAIHKVLKLLAEEIQKRKKAYRDPPEEGRDSRRQVLKDFLSFQQEFQSSYILYYPLGQRVHYRIYYNGKKCFEHHFDAQSQSFDINEAKILDYTVEHAIYVAMAKPSIPPDIPPVGIEGMAPMDYYNKLKQEDAKKYVLDQRRLEALEKIDDMFVGLRKVVKQKHEKGAWRKLVKPHLVNLSNDSVTKEIAKMITEEKRLKKGPGKVPDLDKNLANLQRWSDFLNDNAETDPSNEMLVELEEAATALGTTVTLGKRKREIDDARTIVAFPAKKPRTGEDT